MLLEVRDLHTYYGQSHILQGISFEVAEGEIVALLGPNGMGKTTTLRSIMGLTPAKSGRVFFKREDITRSAPSRSPGKGSVTFPRTGEYLNP